jgi:hypothetical protein
MSVETYAPSPLAQTSGPPKPLSEMSVADASRVLSSELSFLNEKLDRLLTHAAGDQPNVSAEKMPPTAMGVKGEFQTTVSMLQYAHTLVDRLGKEYGVMLPAQSQHALKAVHVGNSLS